MVILSHASWVRFATIAHGRAFHSWHRLARPDRSRLRAHLFVDIAQEQSLRFHLALADLDNTFPGRASGVTPPSLSAGHADDSSAYVSLLARAGRRIPPYVARARQPNLFSPALRGLAKPVPYHWTTVRPLLRARGANLPCHVRAGLEMRTAVEIRQLSYRYPENGRLALDGLSFSVAEEECIGLLGPNGAGKSTLLLHLNGLLPERFPSTPNVWIAGEPVGPKNLEPVRQRVGLLFQDPDDQLISATVFEDVAFGPRQLGVQGAILNSLVEQCLAQVGLSGFGARQAHRLSHGEKRRVCLAGVLACKPSVLVLDEPTSGLDPRGRREFKALLQTLPGAKIIATHDLELVVDLCSRVVILDEGKLVVDGPTVKLLSNEELMLAHGLEKPHSLLHRHPHGPAA